LEVSLKFSFLPGEVKFFDYFENASLNLLNAAQLLQKLLDNYPEDPQETVAQIAELEHRGDFLVHEVMQLLPRTLITPIDGDDIQHLVSAIDDALDTLDDAAQRLVIYQVIEVRKPARRLARLIVEGAQELGQAVRGLRDKNKFEEVRNSIVQINTLENTGDRILCEGLSNLVAHRDDIFDFIRWKEIYQLLESVTDRIEDAGDIIQRVIISNA
jgi:uncharacterized protein